MRMTRCNPRGLLGHLKSMLTLLLLLASVCVDADVVPDLYVARIPVMDESETERTRSISAGLAQVLVKVTGKPEVGAVNGVAELLANAQRYVSEYRYVYPQKNGAREADSVPVLHLQYLAADLETALRALRLPVWPADRPVLLLWVMESGDAGSRLINTDASAYLSLSTALAHRGMPVILPLLDLQDQIHLGGEGLETGVGKPELAQFALASARYPVEHWLQVDYRANDGGFTGHWRLSGEGVGGEASIQAASLTGFMVETADRVVEHFSGNFTYAPSQTIQVLNVVVENVITYEDYGQVVAALKTLELVRDVQVNAMQGTELSLNLQLEGEGQRLFEALDKDTRFTYVAQVGLSIDNARRYSWGGQ